jgi:hypothetical protein
MRSVSDRDSCSLWIVWGVEHLCNSIEASLDVQANMAALQFSELWVG